MTPEKSAILDEIRAGLPDPLPRRLGVAVSGGSDSTALLRALWELSTQLGFEVSAATVDHGLRENSADEAANVANLARNWGIPHKTLRWSDWNGAGNLQDAARRARYRLLMQWAGDEKLDAVALGHTADDQAETVLMRLARAAGVSGLSAMSSVRHQGSVVLLRPMLSITRARLRSFLVAEGIDWIEDPSNQDERFDRIKVRRVLAQLDQIGITPQILSRVAANLTQAREALEHFAQDCAQNTVRVDGGDLCIDRNGFGELPQETRRRIVVAAICWITGAEYPPRQSAVDHALLSISDSVNATLGGCLLVPDGLNFWICREYNAVANQSVPPGEVWDTRWILSGPQVDGVTIRALGEDGLAQLDNWRALGKPRAALLSSPSAWSGPQLLAAPLVGLTNLWYAEGPVNRPEFHASILSH